MFEPFILKVSPFIYKLSFDKFKITCVSEDVQFTNPIGTTNIV